MVRPTNSDPLRRDWLFSRAGGFGSASLTRGRFVFPGQFRPACFGIPLRIGAHSVGRIHVLGFVHALAQQYIEGARPELACLCAMWVTPLYGYICIFHRNPHTVVVSLFCRQGCAWTLGSHKPANSVCTCVPSRCYETRAGIVCLASFCASTTAGGARGSG